MCSLTRKQCDRRGPIARAPCSIRHAVWARRRVSSSPKTLAHVLGRRATHPGEVLINRMPAQVAPSCLLRCRGAFEDVVQYSKRHGRPHDIACFTSASRCTQTAANIAPLSAAARCCVQRSANPSGRRMRNSLCITAECPARGARPTMRRHNSGSPAQNAPRARPSACMT